MNKIILFVFAFVLAAALVFAAGPGEPNLISDHGNGVSLNASERGALLGAKIDNLSEKLQLREDRLKNMSERIEGRALMLRERINATANFGQCVSDMAKARNECYNASKEALNECKNATTNSTEIRACQTDFKDDKKVCKAAFKSAKKAGCGKIMASFMEKIRYAFA